LGVNALSRLDGDVFPQSSVRALILLAGSNDLGKPDASSGDQGIGQRHSSRNPSFQKAIEYLSPRKTAAIQNLDVMMLESDGTCEPEQSHHRGGAFLNL
jgi:hypothetical protein